MRLSIRRGLPALVDQAKSKRLMAMSTFRTSVV
jgi:hypothetical protein